MHASFYVQDYASPKTYFCIRHFFFLIIHLVWTLVHHCVRRMLRSQAKGRKRKEKKKKTVLVHRSTWVCAISLGCHEGLQTARILRYLGKACGFVVATPNSQPSPKSSTSPRDETVHMKEMSRVATTSKYSYAEYVFFFSGTREGGRTQQAGKVYIMTTVCLEERKTPVGNRVPRMLLLHNEIKHRQ